MAISRHGVQSRLPIHPPQQGNLYLVAILKATKEFLSEEAQNNSYSEIRLVEKIKAARLLFGEDKKSLRAILR